MNEADLPPPRYRQEQLEVANGRLRLIVIAVLIVMLAGFALLGIQFRQLNARIDQLATKVNDIDATFGVKFDETSANLATTNTKLDALSGRFAAEFKSLGAEIKAMEAQMTTSTNAIAKRASLHFAPALSRLPRPCNRRQRPYSRHLLRRQSPRARRCSRQRPGRDLLREVGTQTGPDARDLVLTAPLTDLTELREAKMRSTRSGRASGAIRKFA